MYLNGMNALNYLQGSYGFTNYGYGNYGLSSYGLRNVNRSSANQNSVNRSGVNQKTSTLNFQDVLQKATGRSTQVGSFPSTGITLRGKADADTGEQVVGSFINVQEGTSSAIYKPADFDSSNPVYHVKTWDMDGNMTERTVDISKVNTRNSDAIDMYTYSWHLNNSGQYPNAQLNFAVARAYQQAMLKSSYQTCMPTKTNWVNVVNSLMQNQYSAGNLQGYLDYKNYLGFLL